MSTPLFHALAAQFWAIEPSWLPFLASLAKRETLDLAALPEAVQKRLGRPLEATRGVRLRDGVAIVPISGPIFPKANLMTDVSGATSLQSMVLDIETVLANAEVGHVVLDIDSPGGAVTDLAETAAMIRAATARKPITAWVGGHATSAAFWLAAAANEIVISETGIVGSVGVVSLMGKQVEPNAEGEMGFEIVSSRAANKRPDVSTDAGQATVRETLNALEGIFYAHLSDYLGLTAEQISERGRQGGLLVGAEAVAAGFATRVGTLEGLLADVAARRGVSFDAPRAARAPQIGDNTMDLTALTAEQLRAARPDLVEAIASPAQAEGHAAGAAAERARILGIEANAMPGHEDLVAALKADGKTSPAEAAVQILQAEKKSGASKAAAIAADTVAVPAVAGAPAALPGAAPAAGDSGQSPEQQAEADWTANASLRAEFGNDKATFLAFRKNEHRTRIKGAQAA